MLERKTESNYTSDSAEIVDVAQGVPTDRVRWGPIMAGAFAALTMLAVLGTLGAAIGLSAYDPGDDARRFAVGSGIWGIITMIVAFGFGGWLAARSAAIRGRDSGLLNGFMVAGVGIPIILLAIGIAGVSMSSAAVAKDRNVAKGAQFDGAQQASAVISPNDSARSDNPVRSEDVRDAGRRTAWSTLFAFVLAIGAASVAGLVGARDEHHDANRLRHRRSSGAIAGETATRVSNQP